MSTIIDLHIKNQLNYLVSRNQQKNNQLKQESYQWNPSPAVCNQESHIGEFIFSVLKVFTAFKFHCRQQAVKNT